MKKYLLLTVIQGLLIFFIGCGKRVVVSTSPNLHQYNPKIFAIFPFADSRSEMERAQYADAKSIVTDAFETFFMEKGFHVVERRRIEHVLNEVKFSHTGNVEQKQLKEIGVMTNADVVILGLVRSFRHAQYQNHRKPKKPSRCTSISFSVKAIHIESGEILWKGSITSTAGFWKNPFLGCEYDVIPYADKVARDIVSLISKKSRKKVKSNPTR